MARTRLAVGAPAFKDKRDLYRGLNNENRVLGHIFTVTTIRKPRNNIVNHLRPYISIQKQDLQNPCRNPNILNPAAAAPQPIQSLDLSTCRNKEERTTSLA